MSSSSDEEEQEDHEGSSPEEEIESTVVPQAIESHDLVLDLSFHPVQNILAAAHIDGTVIVYSIKEEESRSKPKELLQINAHKKSCRGLAFSQDGNLLFTISKDKSIRVVDVESGAVKYQMLKAHENALYSVLVVDEKTLATGDDNGVIQIWDTRKKESIISFKQNEDYISDMATDSEKRILLATSGDGTLSAFNVRRRRFDLQSENMEDELMTVSIIKKGKKVVCGGGDGALSIFNWNEFGNISDRFPGHPESIDCSAKINENIICTGSVDGMIRAVNILPNRFMGIVGDHDEFPVEAIDVSSDGVFLASCSHDQKIKFWNVSSLEDINLSTKQKAKKTDKTKRLKSSRSDDFFADL
ncbi:WD repeat-containing protein 55-like [Anneissia japonica]|uniref:WD repeat-containing protein 55-like n=1 Tax=Anneissia japonica TaxID=1529436 RepID=UPI0014257F05|nr:WD repeat-containing protein 55-like [Anneissia japonica]